MGSYLFETLELGGNLISAIQLLCITALLKKEVRNIQVIIDNRIYQHPSLWKDDYYYIERELDES